MKVYELISKLQEMKAGANVSVSVAGSLWTDIGSVEDLNGDGSDVGIGGEAAMITDESSGYEVGMSNEFEYQDENE